MKRPTDEDRAEAVQRFLVGLARGDDANQLASAIADLDVRHNTFPGNVFLELAADALDAAGTKRADAVASGTGEAVGSQADSAELVITPSGGGRARS